MFIGAYALLTRRQLAFELLYFWGCAGTAAALLTPDLGHDFPHYRFLFYFAQHGTIVVAAVLLAAGCGMRTRSRAPLHAWLFLNGYAALVAVLNALADTNFLYLREPPGSASPLDWFGPWPSYIIVVELVALALFYLLSLPVRKARQVSGAMARPWRRVPAPSSWCVAQRQAVTSSPRNSNVTCSKLDPWRSMYSAMPGDA